MGEPRMFRVETVTFLCEKAPYGVGDVAVNRCRCCCYCQVLSESVITRRGSMQTRFKGVFSHWKGTVNYISGQRPRVGFYACQIVPRNPKCVGIKYLVTISLHRLLFYTLWTREQGRLPCAFQMWITEYIMISDTKTR